VPLLFRSTALLVKANTGGAQKETRTNALIPTLRQPGYFTDVPNCFTLTTQFAILCVQSGHRKPQRLVLADGAFWFLWLTPLE
jgi:hypothetical protein